MNAMNVMKKAAAVVLSAAVAVGSLSFSNIVSEGADVTLGSGTETGNYISMPITIRDFAADGMLFDPNPVGNTGTIQVEDTEGTVNLPEPSAKFRPANVGSITNSNMAPTTKTDAGGYLRFTSASSNPYITFWMPSGLTRNDARYLVIKYRTNASATGPYIYHRGPSTNYANVTFPTTGFNNTSTWTTAVIDLAGSDWSSSKSASLSYVTFFTKLASGKYMDMAFAAFFSSKTDADTYAAAMKSTTEYDNVIPKKTYVLQNHLGYGLVMTNTASYVNNLPLNGTNNIAGSQFYKNDGVSNVVTPQNVTLNSGATMVGYGGMMRLDMVQGQLGEDKQLLYTEGTVKYLAEMLQSTLPIAWQNSDGSYNLYYIMGNNLFNNNLEYVGPNAGGTKGLADVLRNKITGGLGTYADAKAKNPKNLSDITTYYDAAYYLLHNIFNDSVGYGKTVSEYNSLRLLEKRQDDGTLVYVFNSAYNDTVYDVANGVIYNSQTTLSNARTTDSGGVYYTRGNILPEATFNPIPNSGYGKMTQVYYEIMQNMAGSTYATDLEKYYSKTNFNFSLEGHAQFVYHEDDDLYFTFTGDDDVYLFINGIRVLDLGGGHAISKAHVNLNDMKDLLGLVEGAVCDFDFYYMERGGGAGNFGIETNMKIVEPSMVSNMLGYQNGVTTGYNGFVDPSKNVGYGYELTNSGNEAITNLTFTNAAIGVTLTKNAITLNSRSNISEMYAMIYDENGAIRARYNPGQLTEELLKQLLAAGIGAGEKFGVYGVKYDITNEDWSAGGDTFTNTVSITADSRDSVTLTGYADWKVQKRAYDYECFNLYDWIERDAQLGVTVTKAELLKPIQDAGQTVNASSVGIVLCSPSGNTDTTALSPNATLNSDGSITYTGANAGVENIYYKVTGGTWGNVVFHYHAYTYSTADDTYVLDYGLPVELNDAGYGFMLNDKAVLAENGNATTTIAGISGTSNYGSFTVDGNSLKYTPTKFMSGVEQVEVTLQVLQTGASSVTKFTGVTMTQTIKVVPANVVYYEDNFAGITYLNSDGNQWIPGAGNGQQSADPDGNYGSDPNYADDRSTIDSNGSVSSLQVQTTADVLSFDFVGTGFELVSRTTYGQYAVIDVTVTDSEGNVVRRQPVITESKGGHLYQVPIISITGMERGNYHVTVKAAGSTGDTIRMFYLDGIRIFNPLDDANARTYYNPNEYNAQFYEVKDLIAQGNVIYANASESTTALQFTTGTTLIEDVQSNGVLTSISNRDEYLRNGPNNEIYLDGNAAVGMIAFYLTVDPSVAEGSRTIQIGAHRKVDSVNGASGFVRMTYGSTAADLVSGTNSFILYNGAEQYFTIDVANLVKDDQGRYLVMIGTNGSESAGEILSLTSLKISGYTVSSVETELVTANAEGSLSDLSVVNEATQLYNYKSEESIPGSDA